MPLIGWGIITEINSPQPQLSSKISDSINQEWSSSAPFNNSVQTSPSNAVDSLSTATGSLSTSTSNAIDSLSTSTSGAVDSLSTATGSLSTATSDASSAVNGNGADAGTVDAYHSLIHDRLYSQWEQPASIPTEHMREFAAILRITILRDGSIGAFSLAKPSGNPIMDQSVLEAARKVIKIAPVPEGMGAASGYTILINFTVNDDRAPSVKSAVPTTSASTLSNPPAKHSQANIANEVTSPRVGRFYRPADKWPKNPLGIKVIGRMKVEEGISSGQSPLIPDCDSGEKDINRYFYPPVGVQLSPGLKFVFTEDNPMTIVENQGMGFYRVSFSSSENGTPKLYGPAN